MSRGLKQFVYGAGFLLFFSAIIYGAYALTIKPVPTCFDKRQNGTETGIDCGGGCAPCAQKYAKDIEVESIGKYSAGDEKTVIVAYIKNPNEDYGMRDFVYTMEVKGTDGKSLQTITDHTFMYDRKAKSGRYLLAAVDTAVENVGDISITFSGADVVSGTDFVEPNVVVKESSTDITGLKKLTVPMYVFAKDLGMKSTGEDVLQLEEFLARKGFFKKTPDATFDLDTKLALVQYQKSKKIASANGIFGASTRKVVNAEIDRVTKVVVEADAAVTVNGSVKNNGVTGASKTLVTSFIYDSTGAQLGASKTELENIEAAEERPFKIVFPKSIPVYSIDPIRTQIFVDSVQ